MNLPQQEMYSLVSARLATLQTYPKKTLSARIAAHAGFYYTGIEDELACFYCGGILDRWQDDDDIYLEHLLHFPTCAYICRQWGTLAVAKVCQVKSLRNIPFEIQRGFIYAKILGRKLCTLCFKMDIMIALYPCGHASWCVSCSDNLSTCPKCKKQVTAKMNIIIN